MNVDDRLRTALLDAVSDRALDEERALRAVRSHVETVELVAPPKPRLRHARVVAALAACALLVAAIAVPLALRSARDSSVVAASEQCGRELSRGYRSTATVRLLPVARSAPGVPRVTFADPVRAALALCDTVRARFRADGAHFAAATDADRTLLSLVVSTPHSNKAAALARDWALAFVQSRRAGAARQFREQHARYGERVRRLLDELRSVDTELAKAAPEIYGDVLEVDFPSSRSRLTPPIVPAVPEEGSVELLNLAYERVALRNALDQAANAWPDGIAPPTPNAYAIPLSRSHPIRFPASADGSGPSGVVVAIALLASAAMLAAGGFLVVRRRARAQSP